MPTAFLVERTTRDLKQRLGLLTMSQQSARDLADNGQALMIGNCDVDRTVKKIAGAIRNFEPSQCVVVCHSYELADRVAEESNERGAKAFVLWSGEPLPRDIHKLSAIITVPENLYRIRAAVVEKRFLPSLLFLFDPNGITFSSRSADQGGSRRAVNISVFRAGCLASGCQILPVICVTSSPGAFNLDTVYHSVGAEAMVYADGGSVRTAHCEDNTTNVATEPPPETAEIRAVSPLDEPVTVARQKKSRVLLVVTPKVSEGDKLLEELGVLRGYPIIRLGRTCDSVSHRLLLTAGRDIGIMKDIAADLTKQIALANKQVILFRQADKFYDRLTPRNALFVLSNVSSQSLITVPGPDGLSGKNIEDLCSDISRWHPGFLPPSLYEPGVSATTR